MIDHVLFFFPDPATWKLYVSNEKRAPGWLGYIGDEILPSYIGHYNKPV